MFMFYTLTDLNSIEAADFDDARFVEGSQRIKTACRSIGFILEVLGRGDNLGPLGDG